VEWKTKRVCEKKERERESACVCVRKE